MILLIHFELQRSLKIGNGGILSSHTLVSIWLLIHGLALVPYDWPISNETTLMGKSGLCWIIPINPTSSDDNNSEEISYCVYGKCPVWVLSKSLHKQCCIFIGMNVPNIHILCLGENLCKDWMLGDSFVCHSLLYVPMQILFFLVIPQQGILPWQPSLTFWCFIFKLSHCNLFVCRTLQISSRRARSSKTRPQDSPDSNVHGANMGSTWVLATPVWAPCWPHKPCYQGGYLYNGTNNGCDVPHCNMLQEFRCVLFLSFSAGFFYQYQYGLLPGTGTIAESVRHHII